MNLHLPATALCLAALLAACQPGARPGAAEAEARRVISGQSAVAAAKPAPLAPAYFQCGDTLVEFSPGEGTRADMRIANVAYAMEQVVAASGAKYQNLGDAGTVFWNKGNAATVTVNGQALPPCAQTAAPVAAKPDHDTWRLEDLNRAGVIDGSSVTLALAPDGRVFGNAGCNHYSGRYTLEGDRLSIHPAIVSTQRACLAEAMMRQEHTFLQTLPTMTRLKADASGALQLSDDKGNTLLFRKAD